METDTTNHVTLEYLSNPVYHSGIFETKLKSDQTNLHTISSADIKFYKKRITALSRDMMRGNVNGINTNVQETHTAFVKAAIQHFKEIDKNELLQKEYKDSLEDVERKGTQAHVKNSNENNKQDFHIDAANKALFEIPATQTTLDTFVTSKTLKMQEPIKLPQRRRINLKSEEFRLKGVRTKKDN
jgi:hypothetical protein